MATDRKDVWRTTTIALVTSLFTVIATGLVQGFREDVTWRRDHRLREMQAQVLKAREAIDLTDAIIRQGASLEEGMKRDFELMGEWTRAIKAAEKTHKWEPPKAMPKNTVEQMLVRLETDGPKLALLLHEVWVTDQDEEPFKAYGAWVRSLDSLTGAYWAVLDATGYAGRVRPSAHLSPDEAKQNHKAAAAAEAAARKHLEDEVQAVTRLHAFPTEVRFIESERARWAFILAWAVAGGFASMLLMSGLRYAWARYRAGTMSDRAALPKTEDAEGRGEFHGEPSGD